MYLAILMIVCIFAVLGGVVKRLLPDIFASTGEVIQTVREKASGTAGVPFEEVSVQEEDVSGGYYYRQLNEEEQALYKELYQGLMDTSDVIYMHTPDMEAVKTVSRYILCDMPQLFWCSGEMQMTGYEAYSEVRPVYTYMGGEKDQKQAEIDSAVQECFTGISGDMSEYDKIKYVFEYLVNTVDYNLDAPDNQTIYSSLAGKSSVCAGYSRGAQYLLNRLGIECIYVTGNIPGQGAHAWNIVNCGGQYYQMDVTFGDPVFIEAEGGKAPPEQSINYDYLCCSDAEIMKNHTADTFVTYPQCNSMDLNYYRLNGMYYETFDPDQLLLDMNNSIYNMESSFTCKFASDSLYEEAHDMVLDDLVKRAVQNLLDYYGLVSVQYTYIEDAVMDKITIYWNYE